jgi:hypothetical protein
MMTLEPVEAKRQPLPVRSIGSPDAWMALSEPTAPEATIVFLEEYGALPSQASVASHRFPPLKALPDLQQAAPPRRIAPKEAAHGPRLEAVRSSRQLGCRAVLARLC